jgi:hypothetical protein
MSRSYRPKKINNPSTELKNKQYPCKYIKCNSGFNETLGNVNPQFLETNLNTFLSNFLFLTDYHYSCHDTNGKKIIERGVAQKLCRELDGINGYYLSRNYEKLGWSKSIIKRVLLNNQNINVLDKDDASVLGYISDYFDISFIILINEGQNAILIDKGNNTISNTSPIIIFTCNAVYSHKSNETENTESDGSSSNDLTETKKNPFIKYKPISINGDVLLRCPPQRLVELFTSQQMFSTKFKEVKIKSIYKRNLNEIHILAKNNGISTVRTVDDVIKNKTVTELRKELKELKDQGKLIGL